MVSDVLHRLAVQRAACKQWSTALAVVILLVAALGRLEPARVLWAAAPLLLLALAEAGYAAQERRLAEAAKGRKGDESVVLSPEPVGMNVSRLGLAVLSLSIWPFYTGMAAIVVLGGGALAPAKVEVAGGFVPAAMPVVAKTASKAGCGSGGCGTSGGCGSGGCGASSGKGCACGGEGGAKGGKVVAAKPGGIANPSAGQTQPYLQTAAGPRPISAAPPGVPNATGPTAGRMMPIRAPLNPAPVPASGNQPPVFPAAPPAVPAQHASPAAPVTNAPAGAPQMAPAQQPPVNP